MHDSLLTKEGASEADDESTSARGGGEVVDELEDRLAPLTGLDVAWGVDLDAFFQERAQQALPPAMLATGQSRRWVRLKGVRCPRSRKGAPKVTRVHQQPPASTKGTAKTPRGPVGEGSTRGTQLGTAPRDSKGPDPGSVSTLGGRTC